LARGGYSISGVHIAAMSLSCGHGYRLAGESAE